MESFIRLFFLAHFFFSFVFSDCTNGVQVAGENVCLVEGNGTNTYSTASSYCQSIRGIPVKIRNIFENSYVSALVVVGNQSSYIGVIKSKDNAWTYADGSPLTYQNWDRNEPKNLSATYVCAVMDPLNAKWKSAECTVARPFVCSIDEEVASTSSTPSTTTTQSPNCPNGWKYLQETNYCYYLQDFTYSDGVHWDVYDWSTAESNCRQKGPNSHLVSIHSNEENRFVYDLVLSNVANQSLAAPVNDPCYHQQAWIGYYGNGTIGGGSWTDGSKDNYIGLYFDSTAPCPWRVSNDPSCRIVHVWDHRIDTDPSARYVCKMPAMNGRQRKDEMGFNLKISQRL